MRFTRARPCVDVPLSPKLATYGTFAYSFGWAQLLIIRAAGRFLPFYEGCESSLDDTIDTALAPLFSQCVNRPDVMAADPETCSYLGSDIAPSSTHVGWGQFVVDGTRTGAEGGNIFTPTITIGGVLYQKGIFAHASSEVPTL
eukprot:COSAG02_NODE_2614_length_8415_cov_84.832011_3_plen_143_part_00